MLIHGAEVDGRLVDVRVAGGRVVSVTPSTRSVPESVAAGGAALLPGLVDHHVHLIAAAAAARSVDVSGDEGLAPLAAAAQEGEGWLRAVGAQYEVTRRDLDELVQDRPVRVQHRGGSVWTLNSAGLDEVARLSGPVSAEERRTGQIWRDDRRLRARTISELPDLGALGRKLAARGVTTVVDAGPETTADELARLRDGLPQRVESLGPAGGVMPRKIVIADHDLPGFDTLARAVEGYHGAGRPVAVHCVTQVALALLVAVLDTVGSVPGDRVEHAAVCDDALAERVATLGLTVVTQPGLIARNGDHYLDETDPADRPYLWRHAGLLAAGIPVAVSSDGPYGNTDPWRMIAAATTRLTPSGRTVGEAEAVAAPEALRTLLTEPHEPGGPGREIAVGAPADLVLLDRPLNQALADPTAVGVRLTLCEGRVIHDATDPSHQTA